MKNIRILIADDQPIIRDGLKVILENETDFEVAATAEDGLKAYELALTLIPDVILMDIRMPVMDGVESTRIIKRAYPDIKIIMLTTFDDDEYVVEALSYGADGYLLKSIQTDKLVNCIRDSLSGIFSMNAGVASKIAGKLSAINNCSNTCPSVDGFTEREIDIAKLICTGCSNKEIAAGLYLSEGTVKNYISAIYEKIGTNDRMKAVQILKQIILPQKQ